jgi:hypothetical protein
MGSSKLQAVSGLNTKLALGDVVDSRVYKLD